MKKILALFSHNCKEYKMYFMDEISHGTYCGKCHKVLGEIVHSELPPSQDLPSTYYNGA